MIPFEESGLQGKDENGDDNGFYGVVKRSLTDKVKKVKKSAKKTVKKIVKKASKKSSKRASKGRRN